MSNSVKSRAECCEGNKQAINDLGEEKGSDSEAVGGEPRALGNGCVPSQRSRFEVQRRELASWCTPVLEMQVGDPTSESGKATASHHYVLVLLPRATCTKDECVCGFWSF